jgi:hypothetical protein
MLVIDRISKDIANTIVDPKAYAFRPVFRCRRQPRLRRR